MCHGVVVDDGGRCEGSAEYHALQGTAAAQCHVHLSVGKGVACIYDGVVERQTLTLVYGDGPCKAHGKLAEHTFHLFGDLHGILVKSIPAVGPLFASHQYFIGVVLA